MADGQSQEELLKQQKANCIFCRIVAGEIPSKKVYEDERIIAILDINPATKGHTLVLTKEHYPIMPLIPPDEFDHLFGATAALSGAVREGSLSQSCTTFIANGAVAGQQSPHFLFHLIPREKGDSLSVLDVPKRNVDQGEVGPLIKANLLPVMRQHLGQRGRSELLETEPIPGREEAPEEAPPEEAVPTPAPLPAPIPAPSSRAQPSPAQGQYPVDIDQLSLAIEQNPELKALLINNPAKLKTIVEQNPQFKAVFGGLDLEVLGRQIRKAYFAQHPETMQAAGAATAPPGMPTASPAPSSGDGLRPAREMTLRELFAFIDGKERLREYVLYDPDKLKRLIPENERLRIFFEGSNVNAIIQAYQEHAKTKEGVRVTVEPEKKASTNGDVRSLPGPTREEEEEAFEEVREPKPNLDKVGRLFR